MMRNSTSKFDFEFTCESQVKILENTYFNIMISPAEKIL